MEYKRKIIVSISFVIFGDTLLLTMNLHPIIVHFPIALLTVYSILECLRWTQLTNESWNHGTKSLLLILGTIGTVAAIGSGSVAAEVFEGTPTMRLVELHAAFANLSLVLYGILMLTYIAEESRRRKWITKVPKFLQKLGVYFEQFFCTLFRPWFLILFSILGFIALAVTGALGGALVYGPDADPIVSLVYHALYR